MSFIIVSFYKFVTISELEAKRSNLLAFCRENQLKGTIIFAKEGINGTIAGNRVAIANLLAYLRNIPGLEDLEPKKSASSKPPFVRLKVKIKSEIVTLGVPEVSPTRQVGTYVAPEDWNQIISDPEVVVIDTRNNYEVGIGSFERAINPSTESFREFPEYVAQNLDPKQHQKVAMFCTGGIRCEKASSYMLAQGFKEVYHLEGGILRYLENVPAAESMWSGECFVFDERVAVKEGLKPGSYELCFACGHPISEADKNSPQYEDHLSCPHCYGQLTPEKKVRQEHRRIYRQQQKKQGHQDL